MSDRDGRGGAWAAGGLMVALVAAVLAAPARAEDLKGRWYFGGNLSFLSTTDDIRNNANIIFTRQFGDDGIPFTGDPNELQGCADIRGSDSFSQDPFCDPRPDDLLGRETAIEETLKYDLTAGYGLTSWLSLQLDVSYFKGTVDPVDAFLRDSFPVASDPTKASTLSKFVDRETVIPVSAGEITEIPVSLSAIVRFRKDSTLNPYIGAGVGIIFTEMDVDEDVSRLNDRLASLRIRGVGNEFGNEITPSSVTSFTAKDGRVPFIYPVRVTVDDAFEWHLTGGAEYFFNDRLSLVFDARYTFADQDLVIDLGGEDQVDFIIYSEKLFRPDGSLKIFTDKAGGGAPNPLCSENDFKGLGCDPDNPKTDARVNPEGADPLTGLKPFLDACPTQGDFDRDGQRDQCYNAQNIAPSRTGARSPDGIVVVQGGKIDLSGFSVALGVRFHF